MYKYLFKTGHCSELNTQQEPISFLNNAIYDDLFVEAACKSVEACKWIMRNLHDYEVDAWHLNYLKSTEHLSRIILGTDDMGEIESLSISLCQ